MFQSRLIYYDYGPDCSWKPEYFNKDIENVFDIDGSSTQRAFDFHSLQIIDMKSGELVDKDDKKWWSDAVEGNVDVDEENGLSTREIIYKKHVIVIYPTKFEFTGILKFSGLGKGPTMRPNRTSSWN